MLIHIIYGTLTLHIILNDFFEINLQSQIFNALLLLTIGVQVYRFALQWVLQNKEQVLLIQSKKAEQVFSSKMKQFTELSSLPEKLIKNYIMPILIDAITLKNIPHTIAFFIALQLGISYISLFLTNGAVRIISVNGLYALYYHYNKNQQLYETIIQRTQKLGNDKWQIINQKLQKQQV
ncbi:unnamed protein product (macronuclear) [Paramecium tetraurelia]|uniref:Reticulon domain-containing protein n=1 Tax=Paramecium tetraurelia TaxID=5888 RepID=A0E5N2_PARTE|nr:uncharacterized protein GSPATT00003460001 [Paramecium tetraurelia]CAK90599.1 unnamed protein product [Paramecium tetraurelia]|eukprot:XP_001457996.1 hypothetical protein (macronuclear) [Paramecium tetraurelia strain d4-2]